MGKTMIKYLGNRFLPGVIVLFAFLILAAFMFSRPDDAGRNEGPPQNSLYVASGALSEKPVLQQPEGNSGSGGQGAQAKNAPATITGDSVAPVADSIDIYKDAACGVSFSYPKYWKKSGTVLPLPQKPISQAVFDEPVTDSNLKPKNSVFSFVCFDGKKYSFDQFYSADLSDQSKSGTINSGGIIWQRIGNFVYTTTPGGKLIIFQMFFTKYDFKPEAGYEEVYMTIVRSVRF
jgi:hypothetical protein